MGVYEAWNVEAVVANCQEEVDLMSRHTLDL